MGAPELPTDPGQDEVQSHIQNINHPPMPSDDSDNETNDVYEGYQPLPIGDAADDPMDIYANENDAEHDLDNVDNSSRNNQISSYPNLPHIVSIDAGIESQVWSEPRPQELQIELDSLRTEQILTAMANVSLPNMSVPDWARGVPEDRWKDELLQRIRQRKGV